MRLYYLTLTLLGLVLLVWGCAPPPPTPPAPQQPAPQPAPEPVQPLIIPVPVPLPPDRAVSWALHVYSVSGCPACRRQEVSLAHPDVRRELSHYAVVRHHDAPHEARARGVGAYPTLVVVWHDRHGVEHEHSRCTGYLTPDALAGWLRRTGAVTEDDTP